MKHINKLVNAFLAVALLTLAPTANAAQNTSQAEVLRKIHLTNLFEIEAGNLALEKGTSKTVRDYGDRLIKDHTSADAKVLKTATNENIDATVPIEAVDRKVVGEQNKVMDKLKTTSGPDFDRTFAREMDVAHQDAIASLKKAKSELQGTGTAMLIEGLLPTLHDHERTAEKMEKFAE